VTARKRLLQVLGLLALAFLAFWLLRAWGIAGDCKPQEVDGQCGMSSAMGQLFGIITGCVIFGVGMIGLAISWFRGSSK
jgi:hypothetical protein